MTSPPEAGSATGCPKCSTLHPPAAHFCASCGTDLVGGDSKRYAVNANESVASFALISTIMPHASGRAPQTYRLALVATLALPLIASIFGILPFALITAALVVPIVYIVYLYDVNLWEDNPVRVVLFALGISAALSLLFTLLWRELLFDDIVGVTLNRTSGVIDAAELLVLCLLVPIIATLLMLVGPVLLASRPRFDDLMDGLTFGIVSGVGYAAVETLVLNRAVIGGPVVAEDINGPLWVSLILNLAILKPLIYGSAVGIAAAEFSGLGEGYDGFTPRFYWRVAEAAAFLVTYSLGLYLTGLVEGSSGPVLGLVWALFIAGVLMVRVRTVLHTALVEAAVEAAAGGHGSKWASHGPRYCGECEMPLLEGAMFCIICGSSVRAQSKVDRAVSTTAAPDHPEPGPDQSDPDDPDPPDPPDPPGPDGPKEPVKSGPTQSDVTS